MFKTWRTYLVSILLISLAAACGTPTSTDGTSASPNRCVPPPGMPDRPCDPDKVSLPYYRKDSPESIGTTGHAQALVFYSLLLPDAQPEESCSACDRFRSRVHSLEAEYWNRIDFVYLDTKDEAVRPILEEFGIARKPNYLSQLHIIFVSPDRETIRSFSYPSLLGTQFEENHVRSSFDKYLKENE
jgi:hypothetical protein